MEKGRFRRKLTSGLMFLTYLLAACSNREIKTVYIISLCYDALIGGVANGTCGDVGDVPIGGQKFTLGLSSGEKVEGISDEEGSFIYGPVEKDERLTTLGVPATLVSPSSDKPGFVCSKDPTTTTTQSKNFDTVGIDVPFSHENCERPKPTPMKIGSQNISGRIFQRR